jgi:hypothetical protein
MRVIVARSNSFIPSKCKNITHCPESVLRSWIRVALPLRLGAFIRHFVLRKWRNEVSPMRRGVNRVFMGAGVLSYTILGDRPFPARARSGSPARRSFIGLIVGILATVTMDVVAGIALRLSIAGREPRRK